MLVICPVSGGREGGGKEAFFFGYTCRIMVKFSCNFLLYGWDVDPLKVRHEVCLMTLFCKKSTTCVACMISVLQCVEGIVLMVIAIYL